MIFGASGGKARWPEDPSARGWVHMKLPSLSCPALDAGCLLRPLLELLTVAPTRGGLFLWPRLRCLTLQLRAPKRSVEPTEAELQHCF